jgi:ABC-type branched-subunit amino acid transport system ATPase component
MKVTLGSKYKSINAFDQIEIPQFTILTGVNGKGKTHLLEGISLNAIKVLDLQIHIARGDVLLIYNHQLNPHSNQGVISNPYSDRKAQLINSFINFKRAHSTLTDDILQRSYANNPQLEVLKTIAINANKSIIDLDETDFSKYYPIDDGLDEMGLFYQNFHELFTRYGEAFEKNQYAEFKASKGSKDISFLSDEEFRKINGDPPWVFINEVLKNADIGFRVLEPNIFNFNQQNPQKFQLKLLKNRTHDEMSLIELSSGEKVMMSLALAILNSTKLRTFPKLILLDEPDAALHPSLIQKFLDVVINLLCKENNINVILSTHSPTTVALAPSDSIYLVDNESTAFLSKTSKDDALKSLLVGLPALSVQYENRRQIFVESGNDVKYYESIYKKLNTQLTPEISLSFISSGDTKKNFEGNCDQVYTVTETLRDMGNKLIYGLVDWDSKNDSQNGVFVFGQDERYSIENFILDPLLMAAFLMRENLLKKEILNEERKTVNYVNLKEQNNSTLQNIIDTYLLEFELASKNWDLTLVPLNYISGLKLYAPKWYLFMNGHELEQLIMKQYPELGRVVRGSSDNILKMKIVDFILSDYTEFIPMEFLEIFDLIQKH